MHTKLCRKELWVKWMWRKLRNMHITNDLQRYRNMYIGSMHAKLYKQSMWLEWLQWQLRNLWFEPIL